MSDSIVLAYSGGVDTSVAIKWIPEHYKMDVITLTVDIGNVPDLEAIRKKAIKLGVKKAYVIDAREEFIRDYCWPALQADAIYEGSYPLATALGRPLIARLMARVALENGATAVAHGCTGKGNDQVRLDVGINTLAPDLKIVAPAREWGMTREQTIRYAQRNGIPIPVTKKSPYSISKYLNEREVGTSPPLFSIFDQMELIWRNELGVVVGDLPCRVITGPIVELAFEGHLGLQVMLTHRPLIQHHAV